MYPRVRSLDNLWPSVLVNCDYTTKLTYIHTYTVRTYEHREGHRLTSIGLAQAHPNKCPNSCSGFRLYTKSNNQFSLQAIYMYHRHEMEKRRNYDQRVR